MPEHLVILIGVIVTLASQVGTLIVAYRLGVSPAQKAVVDARQQLIDVLRDTNAALCERVAVLEATVTRLQAERDDLERRVRKLERVLTDKLLTLGEDRVERLLGALTDEEPAA